MENTKKEMLAKQIFAKVNNSEEFCKAFVSAEDASSVQKVLNENGFDVSVEGVEAIFADGLDEILKFKNAEESGELDEDQLEDVAGGGFIKGTLRTAASAAAGFGFGCLCGVCPAASAATPYVVGGLTAWSVAGYMKKGW